MIITTWIVYILARKGAGLPFLPITSSDIDVVESEAVSVLQHWLKKTEEEASQGIKEKLSINCPSQGVREKMSTDSPPTHGQDVHVTRDVVKHHLSKSDMSANQSQEVLEERTRIQFIRWRLSCARCGCAVELWTSCSLVWITHTSSSNILKILAV
uniref:Spermatogenesis associated 19 n=1 Tax=Macaca fascicularis TaxID=9541 RepID=A0A7N9CMT6_MACFA